MSLSRIITLHQPRRLEIGANAAARVGEWAADAARILVLATPLTAGFADRLGLAGTVTLFDAIPGEPDIATFEAALAAARQARPDLVVGLGGGSVMDVAKLVAAMWDADQTLADVAGPNRVAGRRTRLVQIATTAGVSKLTVYSHFGDKETLFAAAIAATCEEVLPEELFAPAPAGTLREQLRSEQFNPILRSIATIYVEYQSLLDENGLSEQAGRNLDSLFEELRDILEENGAEIIRSEVGTVRQNKVCKVIKKIPTGDKAKHNTIAHSRKPGVVRDRTVLYHEYVDVYVYDPTMAAEPEHAASVPDAAPLAAGMTETASDQAAAADTAFTEPLPAASIDQTAEPAAGAADAASPVAGTGASEPVMPAAGTADDASESAPVPAPSRLPTDDAPAMPAAGTDEPAWPSESAAETTMDKDR